MRATSAPNPGCVGVLVGATVVGIAVVGITVGAAEVIDPTGVVVAVGADAWRTLNSAVPTAWFVLGRPTELAVTRYSSGLNVDASTSNETAFRPLVPCVTCTVPDAPANAAPWVLSVGWNDDERTVKRTLSPTARFVVPVMVNLSPTLWSPIGVTVMTGVSTRNWSLV